MIAVEKVVEIRRLLALGKLSNRNIAMMTGISRATVAAIASGKRRDFGSRLSDDSDEPAEPAGPLVRCPGCGGMVFLPCRLCRLRAQQEELRQARRTRTQRARRLLWRRMLLQMRRVERRRQPCGGQSLAASSRAQAAEFYPSKQAAART